MTAKFEYYFLVELYMNVRISNFDNSCKQKHEKSTVIPLTTRMQTSDTRKPDCWSQCRLQSRLNSTQNTHHFKLFIVREPT